MQNWENKDLKGLSHEIFWPVFWPVWVHLGLNMNCLWFLNFNGAPSILDNYFKFDAFQAKHNLREGLATEPAVLQFL
jgi:hypothetical protein